MKKLFLSILVICSLLSENVYAVEFLYKKKYFEIPYNKALDNCGSHLAIGKGAEYILKKRINGFSKDFIGKSLILTEHKIFKSDKYIKIYRYYDFEDPLFKDNFKLTYTSDNFYVFSQEFENFPDKEFYKNIILFIISRTKLEINMGAIYIKSEPAYEKYNELDFNEFKKDKYEIGRSIISKFNRSIGDIIKDGSWANYTSLAGCILEEAEEEKPKI
jgi:hypothetical protein